MDTTTYMIWNASTDTIIARGMPRDNALDLLGMLMTWNKGVQAWQVQVDYCEEEANRLPELTPTPKEQTLLDKQIAEIKEKFNTFAKPDAKQEGNKSPYIPMREREVVVR